MSLYAVQQTLHVGWNVVDITNDNVAYAAALEVKMGGVLAINRENNLVAVLSKKSLAHAQFICLKKASANFLTLSLKEGVGHTTTDNKLVHLLDEVLDNLMGRAVFIQV